MWNRITNEEHTVEGNVASKQPDKATASITQSEAGFIAKLEKECCHATGAAESGLAGASGRGEFLFLIDFYQCQYREQLHC